MDFVHKIQTTNGADNPEDEYQVYLFSREWMKLIGLFGEYTGFENGRYIYQEEPYPVPLLDVNSRAVYEEAALLPGDGYVNLYVGDRAVDFQEVIFIDAGHLNYTDLAIVSPPLARMPGLGDVYYFEAVDEVFAYTQNQVYEMKINKAL